jgi:hypothetical protein
MPKIQQCRNGCGSYITVLEHDGKWKPFDVDEDGEVLDLHNCPNSPYNQQGGVKTGQTSYIKKSPPILKTTEQKTTQGGESLDTKRIFRALGELTEAIIGLKEKTIIDTNIYVQQTNQIYNVIAPHLNTAGEKASTLLKSKPRQDIIDPTTIDHGRKADEYERTKKFVTEKEIDPEDSDIGNDEDNNNDEDEDSRIRTDEEED